MEICAAIQAERSGRVYIIFRDGHKYRWTRAAVGQHLSRPFVHLGDLFQNMASVEGKTAQHWRDVFQRIYPDWTEVGERQIRTGIQAARIEA